MEFIQRKTADRAVNHFLLKAADQEFTVTWDRFEAQLPECGFCESGLSCRDCLQGPCISHPFRGRSKVGICGKEKDVLAAQSLLRLVLKGTMSYLDQLNDFVNGVQGGAIEPSDKKQAGRRPGKSSKRCWIFCTRATPRSSANFRLPWWKSGERQASSPGVLPAMCSRLPSGWKAGSAIWKKPYCGHLKPRFSDACATDSSIN